MTVQQPRETSNETKFWRAFRIFLERRFSLQTEKADEQEVVSSMRKNAEFRGANLWTLIFAIFIASIGLNVNATAVIIGAMLISPLMGPIMGIGMGLAIIDLELLKKGGRNLLIATAISIATSTVYFWLTPLHEAQSELLARTTPTVWDVFIAFFGGLAGIVASTRKEKTNVIPGVAIATALMPPLCTAGYGLSSGNYYYFLGALYLYFINSVFICLSTYLGLRFLRFKQLRYENSNYSSKVRRYMWLIIIITVVPSIYLTYRIVQKSIFESNAQRFVDENFNFANSQVVQRSFVFNEKGSKISLLLVGAHLNDSTLEAIRNKLPVYRLTNATLAVRQGLNAENKIDISQIRSSILAEIVSTAEREPAPTEATVPDIGAELKALYNGVQYYSAAEMPFHHAGTAAKDSLMVVIVGMSGKVTSTDKVRMYAWLKQRLRKDSISLVIQPVAIKK
ncbi:putative hydrophobic protein (TIGR00341 family) [Chitinophaga dinghuensis]|uniref:Putative hydrophobic protein (TIGR00341 family) n=1 Tax=Chitinophaga dinghuensis TaxID=1539050 RepID=A0A327VZH4_9BACT|nr:TIGR00341 family protein [Chitinophaga dinghuensis]RAJ80325.1 putative hydrophobic protein (TIGR00341 family) [Chitinophaga dinghuensis]